LNFIAFSLDAPSRSVRAAKILLETTPREP
jgi:hypothetical protein